MPTKAYGKFLVNLETVNRLEGSYDEIRTRRNQRGRAAYDHITRSAIIFLASAFEVYIEDVIKECCRQHISFAGDAKNLPGGVKDTINRYVKNENNGVPPTNLCDEGWRDVYRIIVEYETEKLNTPKKRQITDLFHKLVGINNSTVENLHGINDLDGVISFRGEIAHRVRAEQYVSIQQVHNNMNIIRELVIEIDKMILDYFRTCYVGKRLPWNHTY